MDIYDDASQRCQVKLLQQSIDHNMTKKKLENSANNAYKRKIQDSTPQVSPQHSLEASHRNSADVNDDAFERCEFLSTTRESHSGDLRDLSPLPDRIINWPDVESKYAVLNLTRNKVEQDDTKPAPEIVNKKIDNRSKNIPNRTKNIKCEFCDTMFSRRDAKTRHIKRFHFAQTTTSEYNCTMCPASFASTRLLAVHQRVHEPSPTIKCALCETTFTSQQFYQVHICTTVCNKCGEIYKGKHLC